MILNYANCIARSLSEAEHIIERLRLAGFSRNDISALFSSGIGRVHAGGEHSGNGSDKGALSWLAGFGTLTVPGVDALTAAGPFLAVSRGADNGAIGSISMALAFFGLPVPEAKRYEQQIEGGGIWFSVATRDADEVSRARWIFENAGAEDIAITTETKSTPGAFRRNSSSAGLIPKRYRGKRFGRLFTS